MKDLVVRAQLWWLARSREERGATAVEYALMLALIAIVISSAVAYLGRATSSGFSSVTFTPP